MSHGADYLHSHSGLERILRQTKDDKFYVLVDEEYVGLFLSCGIKVIPFRYNGIKYFKVPTYAFVQKGGVFKNFQS